MDNNFLDLVVSQTNLYAEQQKKDNQNALRYSFTRQWEPITRQEYEKFFELIFLMTIVHNPSIQDYWSTDWLQASTIFNTIMSRNRFLAILKFFYSMTMTWPQTEMMLG